MPITAPSSVFDVTLRGGHSVPITALPPPHRIRAMTSEAAVPIRVAVTQSRSGHLASTIDCAIVLSGKDFRSIDVCEDAALKSTRPGDWSSGDVDHLMSYYRARKRNSNNIISQLTPISRSTSRNSGKRCNSADFDDLILMRSRHRKEGSSGTELRGSKGTTACVVPACELVTPSSAPLFIPRGSQNPLQQLCWGWADNDSNSLSCERPPLIFESLTAKGEDSQCCWSPGFQSEW